MFLLPENRINFHSCSSSVAKRRGIDAFTLVEILIVLGIVIILAAMLFPTLQGVYRQGQLAKCTGNMTAYSHAFAAFIADKGTIPPAQFSYTDTNGPGKGPVWTFYLEPYLGQTTANTMKGNGIGVCPAGIKKPNNSSAWDYGMNTSFPDNAKTTHFYPISLVQQPSKRFLLGEDASYQYNLPYTTPPAPSRFDFARHNGKAQLLFVDGHIEQRAVSDIPPNQRTPAGVDFWGKNLSNSNDITW